MKILQILSENFIYFLIVVEEGFVGLHAVLVLEDGSVFRGKGFGAVGEAIGEVVFTTGMVGYCESLTDPSYRGQILCFTYPLIGNYGVPSYSHVDYYKLPLFFESHQIHVTGVIVHEACKTPSHWASVKSFPEWLEEEGVPGIEGIDTRMLVQKLREHGVMMGILSVSEEEVDEAELYRKLCKAEKYSARRFVEEVSPKEPVFHEIEDSRGTVVVLDCGVKLSIVRCLLKRKFSVVRVPYYYQLHDIMEFKPCGVVVSNGPGNPVLYEETVSTIRDIIEEKLPILGICLGNQLIALALGASTFKLKYGHRGLNKPCVDLTTGKSYVTSQNHGYAVDAKSLKGTGLKVWFINADDKTIEGLRHEKLPVISVQFHPEASPGPLDTAWVFDLFAEMVVKYGVSK